MEIRNQIKQAVIDYITLHGYPPTMQEIGQAVGRCKSVINGYVTQMLADGELETDAMQGAPRALRVPGMWYGKADYRRVREIVASISGCDGADDYARGWDDACEAILREIEDLSATNDKAALENILKEAEHIKDKLLSLKKERANAVSRRAKNEMALKELRSLNRTMKAGQVTCLDCGSNHIAYESADSEFSFDVSTTTMRKQILDSIQEKIDIYNEEISRLTSEITSCQKEFDSCLDTKDIPLEAILMVRQEMEEARDADQRISEIDSEIEDLAE